MKLLKFKNHFWSGKIKTIYRNNIIFIILFFFNPSILFSQPVVVGGGASAPSQSFSKVIRLMDADSKKPLTGFYFTLVRNDMPFFPGKTDSCGYAKINFSM